MKKRIFAYSIISIFFLIISIRLVFICFIEKDNYQKLYKQKTDITVLGSSAPRGRILDTNGVVLVDNKAVKAIYYNKIKGIKKEEELNIAKKLAKIITIDEANELELKKYYLATNNNGKDLITDLEYSKVEERKLNVKDLYELKLKRITKDKLDIFSETEKKAAHIYSLMNDGYNYEKKLILKNVNEEECAKVVESFISGITVEMSWDRVYLYNDTLRSILGNVGSIPKENISDYLKKGYSMEDTVGISYLEKQYESYLKGEKAIYKLNSDNTLKQIKKAKKGNDLVLSIDINIQKKVDEVLKDKLLLGKKYPNTEFFNEAYAIISNPMDGSILAIGAQRLNEDNTFSEISTNIIKSSYMIGSTVKAATMSVGYKYNLFDVNKYVTDKCIKLYLIPKKCSHKNLGRINDIKALAQSSNYFQFMIAINLIGNKYYPNMKLNASEEHFKIYRSMLKSYGLGAITQIDLPDEETGIKGSDIKDDLLLNLTIGQYDTYTPIELVQYINTIASTKRMAPSLMKEIVNDEKIILKNETKVLNNIEIDDNSLSRLREGMKKVLTEGTGVGYIDKSLNPVGKSGTSQAFYNNYPTNTSSFVGYFPADNPKYSIVVITPHIFNKNGKNDLRYYGATKISKEITNFLNEY